MAFKFKEEMSFVVPIKRTKGRIEPGTRHGSRPHRNKKAYTRKGKNQGGGSKVMGRFANAPMVSLEDILVALKSEGTVVEWGDKYVGRVGVPHYWLQLPQKINGLDCGVYVRYEKYSFWDGIKLLFDSDKEWGRFFVPYFAYVSTYVSNRSFENTIFYFGRKDAKQLFVEVEKVYKNQLKTKGG